MQFYEMRANRRNNKGSVFWNMLLNFCQWKWKLEISIYSSHTVFGEIKYFLLSKITSNKTKPLGRIFSKCNPCGSKLIRLNNTIKERSHHRTIQFLTLYILSIFRSLGFSFFRFCLISFVFRLNSLFSSFVGFKSTSTTSVNLHVQKVSCVRMRSASESLLLQQKRSRRKNDTVTWHRIVSGCEVIETRILMYFISIM